MSRSSSPKHEHSKGDRSKTRSLSPLPSGAILKFVEEFITNNGIAIFSKSWCPYCVKAKELFNERGLKVATIELDLEENGAALQKALKYISGQKSVPNIFINNQHIGGFAEVAPIFEAGVLEDLCSGSPIDFEYDLIVIGGGSGGLATAKEAAKFGKKVALCDFVVPTPLGTKWGLGGTCVNVGCIPKKLTHRASLIKHDMRDASEFGWELDKLSISHNWETMVERVQNYIKSLNFSYRKLLVENNVKYFNAFASFVDKHTLKLKTDSSESVVTARTFLIAVGGRPKYPDTKGAKEFCITSDDLFSMRNRPGKTLVVGGSYVALECAGFLAGLGYDTTVMARSILLRGFDQQIAQRIEDYMTTLGVKFVKSCVPCCFEKKDGSLMVHVKGDMQGKKNNWSGLFDTVLLAMGREPCTKNLNLETVGVKINPTSGKILTDAKERTSVCNIFALGDVAEDRVELTPVAIQAGKLLAARLYNMKTHVMDYKNVPTTVFTPCEYGCVGFSEDDALKQHGTQKIEVYHQEFSYLESVLNSSDHPKGYAKLIALKENGAEFIIGAHILSPNAGEIIQGFALAIKMGATKRHFDDLVGIHPTIAEIFTTLEITKSSGQDALVSGC